MKELKDKYRAVFSSPLGQEVLADIVVNKLKFGCFLSEALGDIALHNAAIEILNMVGAIEKGKGVEVIRSLMMVAPSAKG